MGFLTSLYPSMHAATYNNSFIGFNFKCHVQLICEILLSCIKKAVTLYMLLFSDLHLSTKTFDTCMKVLRKVHQEAKKHNVPVGFLGDFFDHVYNKGTLPVDVLNALLLFFSTEWSVPMVMIPGNHDYFDASETEHGLTPFKYASKYITIIDEPTVLHNRLWIPWRRDHGECARIIAENPTVSVIFGHFDIIGFKLNASRVSNEGLSTDMFPTNIPIYTGHYHTPQKHKNICYLGSPYQLTLSEAEDKKALVFLSSDGSIERELPIEIGRKQYKWSAAQLMARHECLRPNDRVSVSQDASILDIVAKLRENGVDVLIRKECGTIETRIEKPEKKSEMDLLREYSSINQLPTESGAWAFLLGLFGSVRSSGPVGELKNVVPVRMTISGFGPFSGPVSVALSGEGFTLVSGRISETEGSNGSGKSIVTCGALLWVFSGIMDGRSGIAFDDSSILHNGNGPAFIILQGIVDGHSFKIKRTLACNPRKHTLNLWVNGQDRTRSTLSATQKAIASEIFGRQWSASELWTWLLRNCCWSQEAVTRFCDASDIQAKAQIQHIAKMELWTALHAKAKEVVKETHQGLKARIIDEKFAEAVHLKAMDRLSKAVVTSHNWKTQHESRLTQSRTDVEKMEATVARLAVPDLKPNKPNGYNLNSAKRNMRDARTNSVRISTQIEYILDGLPVNWQGIKPMDKKTEEEEAAIRLEQCKVTMSARRIQLNTLRKTLEDLTNSESCPQCHRPFKEVPDVVPLIAEYQQKIEGARVNHLRSVQVWKEAADDYKQQKENEEKYKRVCGYMKQISQLRRLQGELAKIDLLPLENVFQSETRMYEESFSVWSRYDENVRILNDLRTALASLVRSRDMISMEQNPCDTSDEEVLQAQAQIKKISDDISFSRQKLEDQKRAVQWLGPRGIQTYVMEYTVKKLGALTTGWLERFFGPGASFIVSFDSKERLVRRVSVPRCAGVMSGGQFRRVQLASFLAWKSLAAEKWPLMIMDECCQSMDPPGISSVQEILRDWCEEETNRTCFFITHESGQFRDTSIYHNHLQIEHTRGRSCIIDEPPLKKRKK